MITAHRDDDGRPKTGNDVVTNKEFDSLEKKVDKMEHSIGSIITKLDAVLVRIGVMQEEPEGDGNATFMLDLTQEGEVEDFVPGDGSDGIVLVRSNFDPRESICGFPTMIIYIRAILARETFHRTRYVGAHPNLRN